MVRIQSVWVFFVGETADGKVGILPHDGRDITFKQLGDEVVKYYNFSPSLSFFVSSYLARILKRNYYTDKLDLNDICVHNGMVRSYLVSSSQLIV